MKTGMKVAAALTMAVLLHTTGSFQMGRAEAGFNLGGAMQQLGDSVSGAVKNAGNALKADVSKRLNIQVSTADVTTTQGSMLGNLGMSAYLFQSAALDIQRALNLHPETYANKEMVLNNLRSDFGNRDFIKAAQTNDFPDKEVKVNLKQVLSSTDQQKKDSVREAVRLAEIKRVAAGVYTAWAIKDAFNIVKTAGMGLGNPSNDIETLKTLIQTAKNAESLCGVQNKNIKVLNSAIKDYRKATNQKSPSPKEAFELTKM